MPENLYPVQIRPHLIPFIYKEFQSTTDVDYLKVSKSSCKITSASSLGKILLILIEATLKKIKPHAFYISFVVPKELNKPPTAHIYYTIKSKEVVLMLPKKIISDINYILEDFFRYTFVTTILTTNKYAPEVKTKDIILNFMQEYNLEEHGYRLDSMKKLFHRSKNEINHLKRFQVKSSNRVLNYNS